MDEKKDSNLNMNSIPDNEGEFNYVQEKIKPKTRKRIKKVLSVAGLALLAGIVFGLSARVMFMLSKTPMEKVLGIEPQKEESDPTPTSIIRSEVTFPTNTLSRIPTKTPTKAPTDVPEEEPTDTVTGEASATPTEMLTPTPDASATPDVTGSELISAVPIKEASEQPGDGENLPDSSDTAADSADDKNEEKQTPDQTAQTDAEDSQISPLEGYLGLIAQMREIALSAQESLVRVYAVTTGVNWLEESIETRQELTGVLMGNNGIELLLLVDYEMLSGADRIEVQLSDGKLYDAALYGADQDSNMAVISVELEDLSQKLAENIKYIQLGDSEGLSCGEPVIAIGRPNGYYGAMEFGYVSHTGIYGYIMDGCVDEFVTGFTFSSNGDGVVTDYAGNLVGIIRSGGTEGSSGSRIMGINSLKPLILKLLNGSPIPWFGVRCEDIPDDILENMGIENGIYVNEAAAASPAGKAGLKKGDVILSVMGEEITDVSQFYRMLLQTEAGTRAEVQIYRAGRPDDPFFTETVVIENK